MTTELSQRRMMRRKKTHGRVRLNCGWGDGRTYRQVLLEDGPFDKADHTEYARVLAEEAAVPEPLKAQLRVILAFRHVRLRRAMRTIEGRLLEVGTRFRLLHRAGRYLVGIRKGDLDRVYMLLDPSWLACDLPIE